MLTLLLGLELKTCKTAEILLDDGLVHGRPTTDTLAIVVCDGRPPISLALDIPEDNVLDGGGHPRNLPGDIRLPASPSLGQVLQDCLRLVLLDRLRHHVENVMHDGSAKFEIVVGLDSLLRNRLRDTLAVATLELTSKQVAQPDITHNRSACQCYEASGRNVPSLQQRDDATHEEQPNAPARSPEAATRTLPNWTRVEAIVDQVFQILAGPDLVHELVLIPVHTSKLADMVEGVENTVGELFNR